MEIQNVPTPPVSPDDVAVKVKVSARDDAVVLEVSVPYEGKRLNLSMPLSVRQTATFANELTLAAMHVERAINERSGIVFPTNAKSMKPMLKLPAKP